MSVSITKSGNLQILTDSVSGNVYAEHKIPVSFIQQTDGIAAIYKVQDTYKEVPIAEFLINGVSYSTIPTAAVAMATLFPDDYQIDNQVRLMRSLGNPVKAQTFPPVNATTGNSLSNQVLKGVAVQLDEDCLITSVTFVQNIQGSFTASNVNGIALYKDVAGVATKVAETANDGNIWKKTAGAFTVVNFSTPYVATKGLYYVCALYCQSAQTTAPAIAHSTAGFGSNTGLSSQNFTLSRKMAFTISSQTSFPASFNMSTTSNTTTLMFFQLI